MVDFWLAEKKILGREYGRKKNGIFKFDTTHWVGTKNQGNTLRDSTQICSSRTNHLSKN
jgi:hypothetical protein